MTKRLIEDWIEGYLQFTDNSEPPRMFRLWTAISVIAAVLQRKCRFNWGSLVFYPNMYVVLVGPPAARKGTAMNQGFPFIEELDINRSAEATTRESLIQQLRSASDSEVGPDGSLLFHASLTIWSQELTVFLGYNNEQLLSDLTDWFDCRDNWKYQTKHEGTDDITGVFVNLFGATTPDLIRSTMPLKAIGGGLTSRMIFVFEHNKGKVVPYPGLSKEEMMIGKDLREDLAKIRMLRGRFVVEDAFIPKWVNWYSSQEGNPPFFDTKFNGYFERRATHILKLSMIVNAARTSNMIIRVGDLERAISILEETEKKMPQTFAGVGRYTHSELLVDVMRDIGMKGEMTRSELLTRYSSDADKWTMEKIIETLEASKFILAPVIKEGDTILRHRATYEKKKEEKKNANT